MGLVRLVVFGFVGLSVIYVAISIYSRSVRREKLEKSWDGDHPDGGESDARQTYIETGMQAYQVGIRRKLILLVYVVPAAVVIAVLVLTNWN